MKRSTIILGALLVPAMAYAQQDPDAPQPPPPPAPAPAPTAPAPTVVETQPAPPATNPVVVVNPNQAAPAPQPVYTNPETDVYDAWNAPVFATGAIVFAGTYGASVIEADSSNHPGANRLYVPVVGPWLALNDWGNCPISNPSCDQNTTDKVLLVADGVFQAAGLITMLDGVLEPSRHHVIARTADKKVHVTPTHNGLMVFGHF